ncbi:MAG: hypothetical protein LUQ31_09465 [Methanoregula sp.]|nr:hypothetical protein [Methanoregula sp.]
MSLVGPLYEIRVRKPGSNDVLHKIPARHHPDCTAVFVFPCVPVFTAER